MCKNGQKHKNWHNADTFGKGHSFGCDYRTNKTFITGPDIIF